MYARSSMRARLPKQLFVCLAMLAIAIRAILPAGYMFAPSNDGLVVQLCGSDDAQFMRFDADTGHVELLAEKPTAPETPQTPKDRCAFSITTVAQIAPDSVYPPGPSTAGPIPTPTISTKADFSSRRIGAPLPARGPPLHA